MNLIIFFSLVLLGISGLYCARKVAKEERFRDGQLLFIVGVGNIIFAVIFLALYVV